MESSNVRIVYNSRAAGRIKCILLTKRCAYAPWCAVTAVTYPKAAVAQLQLAWQVMKWGWAMLYDDGPPSGGLFCPLRQLSQPSSSLIRTEGHLSVQRKRSSLLRASVWRLLLPTWQQQQRPPPPSPPPPRRGGCIINKSNPINVQISWQRHRAMLGAQMQIQMQMRQQASSLSSSLPAAPGTLISLLYRGMKVNALLYAWRLITATICLPLSYPHSHSQCHHQSHSPASPELNACLCIKNI